MEAKVIVNSSAGARTVVNGNAVPALQSAIEDATARANAAADAANTAADAANAAVENMPVFDSNFGGIVCLTLGGELSTTEVQKIISTLADIVNNKKHYILTIYDTVSNQFLSDCEVVKSGTNQYTITSNYTTTTLTTYTLYYSFKTDTNTYTRNLYSVKIASENSVSALRGSKADFESGTMAADDCHAWYTQEQGLSCTMQAEYNLMGDYCLLSIRDMQLLGGWGEMYYSLPVGSLVAAHGMFKSSIGQDMYFSTGQKDGISVLRVAPLNSSETIQEDLTGSSLVVTYKYK